VTGLKLSVSVYADCAERLFDLVDSFAESAKRKAAVWPLQIILLILCPEITQSITKEVGGEEKANKVRGYTVNYTDCCSYLVFYHLNPLILFPKSFM